MLQIFLTAAYIATQGYIGDAAKKNSLTNAATTQTQAAPNNLPTDNKALANQVKSTDLLAELNADLAKEKANNDPFVNKNVKVDVESLGLDNVDNKETKSETLDISNPAANVTDANIAPATNSQPPNDQNKTDAKQQIVPIATPSAITTAQLAVTTPIITPLPPATPQLTKSQPDNIIKNNQGLKIADLPKIKDQKLDDKAAKAPEIIANPDKIIDKTLENKEQEPKESILLKVKKLISADEEAKQKDEEPEIIAKQPNDSKAVKLKPAKSDAKIKSRDKNSEPRLKTIKIDQKKLQQLQEQYLPDPEIEDKKIIPRKKELVNFSTYENPPFLLARSYSKANISTPIILNRDDKIDLLFNAFSNHDLSYFSSAYQELLEPNLRNKFGDTILTYATLMQRHDIMASILSQGANPNLANNSGYEPLRIAIELNDYKSVQLLIESKADINHVDQYQKTYLMQAVKTGFLPIIDLLITNNIDINAIDNQGNSALDIAINNHKNIIAKFLIKKGAKKSQE